MGKVVDVVWKHILFSVGLGAAFFLLKLIIEGVVVVIEAALKSDVGFRIFLLGWAPFLKRRLPCMFFTLELLYIYFDKYHRFLIYSWCKLLCSCHSTSCGSASRTSGSVRRLIYLLAQPHTAGSDPPSIRSDKPTYRTYRFCRCRTPGRDLSTRSSICYLLDSASGSSPHILYTVGCGYYPTTHHNAYRSWSYALLHRWSGLFSCSAPYNAPRKSELRWGIIVSWAGYSFLGASSERRSGCG